MQIVPVLSGKGGTGKTTVSLGVALALADAGVSTAILDLDLENPSLGTACGKTRADLGFAGEKIVPAMWCGIQVMSLAMLPLPDFAHTPTLLNEDRKNEVISHLVDEMDWGDTEILIVDMPPGSGTEVRGLLRFDPKAALLIVSPQTLSEAAARRVVNMAEEYAIPLLGIIQNNVNNSPVGDAGARIAKDYRIPYIGSVEWTPAISEAMESHDPFGHETFTATAAAIKGRFIRDKVAVTQAPDAEEGLSATDRTEDRATGMVPDGSQASQPAEPGTGDQTPLSHGDPAHSRDGDREASGGDSQGRPGLAEDSR